MSDRRAWRRDTDKLRAQFETRRASRDDEPMIDWSRPRLPDDPSSGVPAQPVIDEVSSPFERPSGFGRLGGDIASLYKSPPTFSPGRTHLDAIQKSFVSRRAPTPTGEIGGEPVDPFARAQVAAPQVAEGSPRGKDDRTQPMGTADVLNTAWERSHSGDTVVEGAPRGVGHLVPGDRVGNHIIIDHISDGGMGAVYLAEHALLGRNDALKILLPEFSRQDEFIKRFFLEAKAVVSIDHPAIVHVYDFGYHTDGNAFIVMELLKGESLERRLQRQLRLRVSEALSIVRDVAHALAVAHDAGIIHRDLKPDNIFLVTDDRQPRGYRVKVLDFGLAKLADGSDANVLQTRAGAFMGTPAYMSPEQCRGVRTIDSRTDVYSLGCVLFRLMCGRPPFVSDNHNDIIASHLREEPVSPSAVDPQIPPEISAVVLRALGKSPDDRHATMGELAAELDRFAAGYETGTLLALTDEDALDEGYDTEELSDLPTQKRASAELSRKPEDADDGEEDGGEALPVVKLALAGVVVVVAIAVLVVLLAL